MYCQSMTANINVWAPNKSSLGNRQRVVSGAVKKRDKRYREDWRILG